MKLPVPAIEGFVVSPPANIRAVLVYGPDQGLVQERCRTITQAIVPDASDPFLKSDIGADRLKEDPVFLADEMAALSFFGGKRLIRLTDMGATLSKELQEILEAAPGDAFVLIPAGDLPPRSTLRAFFEKQPHCAAIPCYKDDARTVSRVIAQKLKEEGLEADAEVIAYLQYSFVGDRSVLLRELEKLAIYMGQEKRVKIADVRAAVGESVEASLDAFSEAVASRTAAKVEKEASRLLNEGTAPVVMIRALQRYFARLHMAKGQIAMGKTEKEAMASLSPPVFFKQEDIFRSQLQGWSMSRLEQMLQALIKAERLTKQTGIPADTVTRQLLASLGLSAAA
ncbi:MAG: polymerase subunit delta [Rickettsiales bacterium]|jgi:DNA polymerase-3 subunit delta|nr:polymerase subunit delta [Rickettsiales bacterium]